MGFTGLTCSENSTGLSDGEERSPGPATVTSEHS